MAKTYVCDVFVLEVASSYGIQGIDFAHMFVWGTVFEVYAIDGWEHSCVGIIVAVW